MHLYSYLGDCAPPFARRDYRCCRARPVFLGNEHGALPNRPVTSTLRFQHHTEFFNYLIPIRKRLETSLRRHFLTRLRLFRVVLIAGAKCPCRRVVSSRPSRLRPSHRRVPFWMIASHRIADNHRFPAMDSLSSSPNSDRSSVQFVAKLPFPRPR